MCTRCNFLSATYDKISFVHVSYSHRYDIMEIFNHIYPYQYQNKIKKNSLSNVMGDLNRTDNLGTIVRFLNYETIFRYIT